MKKILLLISVLLAAIVPAAQAQTVFIKHVYYFRTDNSIVRSIDDTTWLTYNQWGDWSVFILSTKSNPTVKVMDMGHQKIAVKDFEIYGNKVYFCGTTLDQTPGVAVAGYFNVGPFPSSAIRYATYDDMTSFERMDLVDFTGDVHFVMVGHNEEMVYHFVDAHVLFPTTFVFREYTGTETIAERLYDIAVTKDYVVFTGRSNNSIRPVLFYVDHTATGLTPNPLPAQYLEYSYYSSQPVWIDHCEQNAIATATLNENNKLFVSAYLGTTHFSTQYSVMNNGINTCVGLKYNKQKRVLDVLTHRVEEETYNSTIYHYLPGCLNYPTSTITGHKKDNYWLYSLSDSPVSGPGASGYFVTTGGTQDRWYFSIHRYYYNGFYCWDKVEMKIDEYEGTDKTVDIELDVKNTRVEERTLYKEQYECEIFNQCGTGNKEEDE